MLADLLSQFTNLPDVWGECAIFAFSGMDGPTHTRSGFVMTFAAQPYGLLVHTPQRRAVLLHQAQPGKVLAATGDVLVVESGVGELALAYAAWHTLVGLLPPGARIGISAEDGALVEAQTAGWVSVSSDGADALALCWRGERIALAFGFTREEALDRAESGLQISLEAVIQDRLAPYRKQLLNDPLRDRLLKKCLSVMRVNTLAAEGAILQSWSTPDRVPHRHMWLWDTVFHSLAMNRVDARLSWHSLKSVLDAQLPDGMIPHMITAAGWTSAITQPPLLAWGVWENYSVLRDREVLAEALPRLEKYLDWDLNQRDRNSNGLLEWFIEGDVNCRSGESGLDNSPRFDRALLMDAVDFSTFAALDMEYLSRIARELGDMECAARWQDRASALSRAIHTELWDAADGFYYDRTLDGEVVRVRAASGFLPLLLADIPDEHVACLVHALQDPAQFNTAFPIPSVAADHPAWSTDMWRGATWVNLNYLISQGLARQGRGVEARWLAEKTVRFVNRYYCEYGVLFEFFDSKDERPPLACDRKGQRREPYDIRRKMDSIRDYHWTAALTACILWDGG